MFPAPAVVPLCILNPTLRVAGVRSSLFGVRNVARPRGWTALFGCRATFKLRSVRAPVHGSWSSANQSRRPPPTSVVKATARVSPNSTLGCVVTMPNKAASHVTYAGLVPAAVKTPRFTLRLLTQRVPPISVPEMVTKSPTKSGTICIGSRSVGPTAAGSLNVLERVRIGSKRSEIELTRPLLGCLQHLWVDSWRGRQDHWRCGECTLGIHL